MATKQEREARCDALIDLLKKENDMTSVNSAAHLVYNNMLADRMPSLDSIMGVLDHIRSRGTVPYDALLTTFKNIGGAMLKEILHYATTHRFVRSYVVGPTMTLEWTRN